MRRWLVLVAGLVAMGCGAPEADDLPAGAGGAEGGVPSTGGVALSTGGAELGGAGGQGGQPPDEEPEPGEPEPPGFWDVCESREECPSRYNGVSVSGYQQCIPETWQDERRRCSFYAGDLISSGNQQVNWTRGKLCADLGGTVQEYPGIVGGLYVCMGP